MYEGLKCQWKTGYEEDSVQALESADRAITRRKKRCVKKK